MEDSEESSSEELEENFDDWELENKPASRETCQRAVNRLKSESLDYNDFLYYAAENPEESYLDESFTFPESIHWEALPGPWPLNFDVPYIDWKRIKDSFASPEYSLWGDD